MNRLTLIAFSILFCTVSSFAQTDIKHFGEKIDAKGMISYDDLLKKLKKTESVETKVYGKVSGVCQVKGCWMTIVSDDPKAPNMFVKFKDYGFFMPLDLAGKNVVMKGSAYREVTSVDELKHYAEDEGKSAAEIAKITQPKEELKFMASGVMILDK
jgi:hypothetical protein